MTMFLTNYVLCISTFLIGRFDRPITNFETFTSKEHGSHSKTGTTYRFNLFEAVAKSNKKKIISILFLTRASVISKNTNHVADQRVVFIRPIKLELKN